MTKRHTQPCSVAAALNVFGDAWTLRVILEAFYGSTRFGQFRRTIGIAKNILSDRLKLLVAEGVLEKRAAPAAQGHSEYHLTEKGIALLPVLMTIIQWGDRWIYGAGHEPVRLFHVGTREPLPEFEPVWRDGTPITRDTVAAAPGPGANDAIRTRFGGPEDDR